MYALHNTSASWRSLYMDLNKHLVPSLINFALPSYKPILPKAQMTSLSSFDEPHGYTILLIYIDDMTISGDDEVGISYLKNHLMCTFKMNDIGSLT